MKKKTISFAQLMQAIHVLVHCHPSRCPVHHICVSGWTQIEPMECALWASLEDAPVSRVVPPDRRRGEVGPQIVTDLSAEKDPDNEDG